MTLAAAAGECVRAWPSGLPQLGFALLLLAQVLVVSMLWTAALAGLIIAGLWLRSRLAAKEAEAEEDSASSPWHRRWIGAVWLGPVVLAQLSCGTWLLAWGSRAFVREDLTWAVMPIALLLAFVVIALLGWIGYRLTARYLRSWPTWAVALLAVAGLVVAAAVHLGRFPALLDDWRIPLLLQVIAVLAIGVAVVWTVQRAPIRPGWMGVFAAAGVWLALFIVLLFAGRIAPLSYPAASAALGSRGMVARVLSPLLTSLGDGDGDGFGRFFGGMDCDDGDADIHPFAHDVPGDGIDQDCFEGDLNKQALAEVAARRAELRGPAAERAQSAILITVDALRSDAVGFGGASRPSSPTMDRLAKRSAVFNSAWSHAPMTRRAFPALLASRYPSNVHWLKLASKYPYTVSHRDNLYLAEVLEQAGFATAMAVPFGYAVNSRFDQGFQQKQVRPASKYKNEINAHIVVADAIEFLRQWKQAGKGRFFLWVHFYEAHFPYHRHAAYDFGNSPFERYLSEVRYIDDQIGKLLGEVDELGLADTTAVFFTSDHGEEFGEHGGETHGDLYPEDLRVPLLAHVPGLGQQTIAQPVGLVDVAPTILDTLGIEVPTDFDGDSLMPLIQGKPMAERPVYAELIPDRKVPRRVVALLHDGWYLIGDFALGARELYHLDRDPEAQHNRFIEAPDRARDMEAALRRYMARRIGPPKLSREKGASKQ